MDKLTAAKAFITIIEQGSFVAASEILNMSRAKTSRCVTELENWTKTKLIHRTTRRLSLTPAGEKMLLQCRKLMDVAEDISSETLSNISAPFGTLRISCSQNFAETIMSDLIVEYVSMYPDVTIDLHISNQIVNLVEERIDLAIRIANDLDPNLIARKFGELQSTLCASPDYLAENGVPKTLDDLKSHNCLVYSNFENPVWKFIHKGGTVSVPISGNISANETSVLKKAALNGLGITFQPSGDVSAYVSAGKLVSLLPEYMPETHGVYGVFLTRKNMSVAQRKFIDLLAEKFN